MFVIFSSFPFIYLFIYFSMIENECIIFDLFSFLGFPYTNLFLSRILIESLIYILPNEYILIPRNTKETKDTFHSSSSL